MTEPFKNANTIAAPSGACPVEMSNHRPCGRAIHSAPVYDQTPVCLMHSDDPSKSDDGFQKEFEAILGAAGDGVADFAGFVFPTTNYDKRKFVAACVFSGATFKQDAWFVDATFMQKADFSGATFTTNADFRGATFTRNAVFSGATFTRNAVFSDATFTEDADFAYARFMKEAFFIDATCTKKAYFFGATFTRRADFTRATFTRNAVFSPGATFTEDADFGGATFTKNADFSSATFTRNAVFSGATFTRNSDFSGATFTRNVDFSGATFAEDADFGGVTFTQSANFSGATFTQRADFTRATFTQAAHFDGATFTQKADFSYTSFTRLTVFTSTKFMEAAEFHETKFRGHAKGKKDRADGLLPGPTFSFTEFSQPERVRFYKTYLGQALFYNCDVSKVVLSSVEWRQRKGSGKRMVFEEVVALDPDLKVKEGSPDEREYALIAELYQQLKKNYDDKKDYWTAGDFHYGELEMKRLHSPRRSQLARWLHRNLGLVAWYKYASEYGESYVRPVVVLMIVLAVFTFLFPLAGLDSNGNAPQPPSVSYSHFGDFVNGYHGQKWFGRAAFFGHSLMTTLSVAGFQRELKYEPSYPWGRALALLELLLTSTLVALFLLAVRRQFKR